MEIDDAKKPFFSIVMPAYNAEKFIGEAIDSVIAQSFYDWELVIVDDCSNDRTSDIIKNYIDKDNRIIAYKASKNSGSAFQPRKKAIEIANSEWILYLDSDDYIEKDYLSNFYFAIESASLDLVLGEMVFVNEYGASIGVTLPLPKVNTTKKYKGRELVKDTLNGWAIGFNCAAIKKNILMNIFDFFDINSSSLADDELMSRYILLKTNGVAFVDAKYYYRGNPESITNRVSVKTFDILESDISILNLIEKEFGASSIEMERAAIMQFHDLSRCIVTLCTNKFSIKDKINIEKKIKHSYGHIKWSLLNGKVNRLKILAMRSGLKSFKLMYKIYEFTWRRK